jgi:hypothetical protein
LQGDGARQNHRRWFSRWKDTSFGGLRNTLRFYLGVATVVFLINATWLIRAKATYKQSSLTGTIFQGACSKAKRMDLWLHLLINILSTFLLAGSNIFMSVCNSPSRQEVDKAHRSGQWLDIGQISFRNLRHISRRKGSICLILAFSSVPYHLLYVSLPISQAMIPNYLL